MNSREAAQKILDEIVEIIGFYREDVEVAYGNGRNDLAERYQISVDTLANLAAGLKNSINNGKYGE